MEESNALNYNAKLLELEQGEQKVAGDIEQENISSKQTSLLSAQEAAYAKANVMNTGSALEQELQSYSDAEFDKQIAAYNNEIKIRTLKSQQTQTVEAAKMARLGAVTGLAGGILGGASSVAKGVSRGDYGSRKTTSNTIPTNWSTSSGD